MVEPTRREDRGLDLEAVGRALSKTGFLLEHRVFETFLSRGHNAFLGLNYRDPHDGTSREMDVVVRSLERGTSTSLTCWASAVVECKSWAEPVVAIGRPARRPWRGRAFDEAWVANDPFARRLGQDWPASLPVFTNLRALSASVESAEFPGNQLVLLERRGGEYRAGNSGIYDSVLMPLAKAMRAEQRSLAGEQAGQFYDSTKRSALVISFPLLVTSGEVVEAEPRSDGLEMRHVPWTRVVRRFADEAMPGSVVVEVVQEQHLERWIDERLDAYTAEVLATIDAHEAVIAALSDPGLDLDEDQLRAMVRRSS